LSISERTTSSLSPRLVHLGLHGLHLVLNQHSHLLCRHNCHSHKKAGKPQHGHHHLPHHEHHMPHCEHHQLGPRLKVKTRPASIQTLKPLWPLLTQQSTSWTSPTPASQTSQTPPCTPPTRPSTTQTLGRELCHQRHQHHSHEVQTATHHGQHSHLDVLHEQPHGEALLQPQFCERRDSSKTYLQLK
jgi:hypothetical protein